MAKNPVQSQKGMSLPGFLQHDGTEEQCREALFQLRWPDGFTCPRCGHAGFCVIARHQRYQCHRCHHQTSPAAETVFERTQTPLRIGFLAIGRLTQHKQGIPARKLSRELGVSYDTAGSMKHKLIQVMVERQQGKILGRRVERSESISAAKTPASGAEAPLTRCPSWRRWKPGMVAPFSCRCAASPASPRRPCGPTPPKAWRDGAVVVSDSLPGFAGIAQAGRAHEPHITGSGRQSAQHPPFHWVNTLLGKVKNAIRGTYHAVDPKHGPRYLAEFEYRFNRRFNLPRIRFLAAASMRLVGIETPLDQHGLVASMRAKGDCWDNAVMERLMTH